MSHKAENKKLSVIIVSFNEKEYLSEAIESCLMQKSEFPFEILIGDDGSTDGSLDLIQSYVEQYPDIIKSYVMDRSDVKSVKDVIPSIRVSNLLKRGFSQAKGEYLALLSGDDKFTDVNKLAKQVAFLEKNKQYVSCYTDFTMFWQDGRELPRILRSTLWRAPFFAVEYRHISCFVFRKTVLNHLLERFCDDTGLLYSIICAGKSKRIPDISFAYRQRTASIMDSSDKMVYSILEVSLFQDVINHGLFYHSALSRYHTPLKYLLENRHLLREPKYQKYLQSCRRYSNDIVGRVADYDNLSKEEQKELWKMVHMGRIYEVYYRLVKKINNGVNMFLEA